MLYVCSINYKSEIKMTKMSKAEKDLKKGKHKVFIDFPSALMKLRTESGIKKTLGSVSEETGFSRVQIKKWETEAPAVVAALWHYMKEYGLAFEDLVKECVTEKE